MGALTLIGLALAITCDFCCTHERGCSQQTSCCPRGTRCIHCRDCKESQFVCRNSGDAFDFTSVVCAGLLAFVAVACCLTSCSKNARQPSPTNDEVVVVSPGGMIIVGNAKPSPPLVASPSIPDDDEPPPYSQI